MIEVLCPNDSDKAVAVTFDSFFVQQGSDYDRTDHFFIYDGIGIDDANKRYLDHVGYRDSYCHENNFEGDADLTGSTISSRDGTGCITFVFKSYRFGETTDTRAGWVASVNCDAAQNTPQPSPSPYPSEAYTPWPSYEYVNYTPSQAAHLIRR